MSDVVAELATRARVSDPKPARCAACFAGSDVNLRFVDFGAVIDRGAIVDSGTMAVLDSIDELHLCEPCVREACEVLGVKPELHQRQLREIRKLELRAEHWRATAARFKAELDKQLAATLGDDEPVRRRRGGA